MVAALNQKSVARLLARSTNGLEVEEVLGAYVVSKTTRRNGCSEAAAARKIRLLICFLHAIDLRHLVDLYPYAWQSILTALHSDTLAHSPSPFVTLGSAPVLTELGREAWNVARRRQNQSYSAPGGTKPQGLLRTLRRTLSMRSRIEMPEEKESEEEQGVLEGGRTFGTGREVELGPGTGLLLARSMSRSGIGVPEVTEESKCKLNGICTR